MMVSWKLMFGLLAEDLDDNRFVGLIKIAPALAGHPRPALAAKSQ